MDTTPHSLTGRAVSCTCPDATYRKRVCKHMHAAEQGAAGKPSVKLAVAPKPSQRERDLTALASMYAD